MLGGQKYDGLQALINIERAVEAMARGGEEIMVKDDEEAEARGPKDLS